MAVALLLALFSADNNMPAKIAMIAITTNNSIRVNPRRSKLDSNRRRNTLFLISPDTEVFDLSLEVTHSRTRKR